MGLKPGPPIKVKLVVSKKKIHSNTPETVAEFLLELAKNKTNDVLVDITNLNLYTSSSSSFPSGIVLQSLMLQDSTYLLETGLSAAPDSLVGKCFYLSSFYDWKLVQGEYGLLLVPTKKVNNA